MTWWCSAAHPDIKYSGGRKEGVGRTDQRAKLCPKVEPTTPRETQRHVKNTTKDKELSILPQLDKNLTTLVWKSPISILSLLMIWMLNLVKDL